jgi:hypothetical protein
VIVVVLTVTILLSLQADRRDALRAGSEGSAEVP